MTQNAPCLRKTFQMFLSSGTVCFLLVFLLLISACTPGRSPGRAFENYTLEYTSPALEGLTPSNALLRVHRFSAAQTFNSTAMLYRSGPSRLNAHTYHRWKAPPPDMVTDLILRDLRRSSLFKAVFAEYDETDASFLVQGRVEEFLEIEEKGSRKALLSLDITLLDRSQREPAKEVVFQKRYHTLEPLEDPTPGAFARSMSRALEKLSRRITEDIYNAVRDLKT